MDAKCGGTSFVKQPRSRSYEDIGRSAVRKSCWILLPTVLMTGMIAYIDRTNLAYAATSVKKAININNSQYGLASGILYLSYCFFQVPSQLVVRKIGAPIWLGILVVAWGIVAASTAAIKTVGQFYALRFLLGVFESGTFPAMFHHLSLFFNERELSMAYAIMLSALSISQVVGGPVAGGLQYLEGKQGLHGWQWLFIIEGCITVVWGVLIPFLLPARPESTRLLSPEEREWLAERQRELTLNAQRNDPYASSFWRMFVQWRLWYYAIMGFLIQAVLAGCIFFVPLIVDSMFTGQFNGKVPTTKIKTLAQLNWQICKVALISAILYAIASVTTVLVGWSSNRLRERNWHIFTGLVAAGIAFMCVPVTIDHKGAVSAFAVMCVAAAGVFGVIGPTVAWIVLLLHGLARELGFGLFNAIGGVGAFSGPTIIGKLSDSSGGWQSSMYFLGACCLAAGIMALFFRPRDLSAPPAEASNQQFTVEEGSVAPSKDLPQVAV